MELLKGFLDPLNQMVLSPRTQFFFLLPYFDLFSFPVVPNILGNVFNETITVQVELTFAYPMTEYPDSLSRFRDPFERTSC